MTTDKYRWLVPIMFAMVFICLILGIMLRAILPVSKDWQCEAVLKGHAIWAVDKDGAPVFQWKSEGAKK